MRPKSPPLCRLGRLPPLCRLGRLPARAAPPHETSRIPLRQSGRGSRAAARNSAAHRDPRRRDKLGGEQP